MRLQMSTAGFVEKRSLSPFQIFFQVFLLLLSSAGPCHADTSVTATLDRATMSIQETAELIVTINGSGTATLSVPEVDGLELSERGQSRQVQLINGSLSSSLAITYLIQAIRPGKYIIPAITVESDGKKLETEAIPLEVVASSQQQGSHPPSSSQIQAAGKADDKLAFLHVETKKESYVGEQVPILIKAYFPRNMQASVNTVPLLKGNGFVLAQLDSQPQQTQENVDGTDYNVLSWKSSYTGIKEGRYPFLLQLDATLLVRQRTRSLSPFAGQDLFADDFFDNFLGGYKKKPIRLASPEMTLGILPLPEEDQPKDFSGAIGDFDLQVTVAPTTVEIGQPLTVTMTIEGTGNFDRVEAPIFPDHAGWKSYTPSSHFSPIESSWKGKKVFEQAVVVKDTTISHIPQLAFSYFDPEKKQYITRSSPRIPLAVKETAQKIFPPPAATVTTTAENQKPDLPPVKTSSDSNLAPLHLETGRFLPAISPIFLRPWFLALVSLCAFSLLLLLGLWFRRLWLGRHPEKSRRKQLQQLLDRAWPALEKAIGAKDSPAFLSQCRSIIRQQMALRWQVPPETITLLDISTRLGADSPLVEIFAAAEKSAYAGFPLSPETMRKYADTLQSECRRLL